MLMELITNWEYLITRNYENTLCTCKITFDTCGCVRHIRADPASNLRCFFTSH